LSATSNLLIFGASARAAAFSALRAGLRPWCADLFADADLVAQCPAMRIPSRRYPQNFLELVARELPGPWMYTGALENWRNTVHVMAQHRPLWGNGLRALLRVRSPWKVARLLKEAGVPCPAVRSLAPRPPGGRWLVKPILGAGGAGIRPWSGGRPEQRASVAQKYLQEHVEGEPCAAVWVGDGAGARLLGATRQLVGEDWLHAGPFRYCGSIGPLHTNDACLQRFLRLGNVLTAGCGLRGLFGVDCILRDDVPYPVEINPRYTASVEVLEYARGVPALGLHRAVFDPDAPAPRPLPSSNAIVGKAILFARAPLVFPADGPWSATLRSPRPVEEMPDFADVPHAGERVEARRPVLTFFARADSAKGCEVRLREVAAELDRWLFGR